MIYDRNKYGHGPQGLWNYHRGITIQGDGIGFQLQEARLYLNRMAFVFRDLIDLYKDHCRKLNEPVDPSAIFWPGAMDYPEGRSQQGELEALRKAAEKAELAIFYLDQDVRTLEARVAKLPPVDYQIKDRTVLEKRAKAKRKARKESQSKAEIPKRLLKETK